MKKGDERLGLGMRPAQEASRSPLQILNPFVELREVRPRDDVLRDGFDIGRASLGKM